MSKAIYVIGGMGPQASAELYQQLVRKAPEILGTNSNDSFPEIVIHSLPVPDFLSDESKKDKALLMLETVVKNIDPDRFSCFAMACNTVHILAPELTKSSSVPLISMIDAVVHFVTQKQVKTIGLLASPTTIKTELYQSAFSRYDIDVLVPRELRTTEQAIRAVIAGNITMARSDALKQQVMLLKQRGAELVLLGCTELPLLLKHSEDELVVSSLDILTAAILERFKQ